MLDKIPYVLFLIGLNINASTINIALASNVSYAIKDLIKEFNIDNKNTNVNITLGSSGKLTAQIKNAAPYDLFMSADMKYPNYLYKNKLSHTKPIIYAKGSLVFLSHKNLDFSKGINILENQNIRRIAIANPKTAPYGKASIEALKKANIYKNIKSKLVFAESISQTVSYSINATDIGIVAKASLHSPFMSKYKENINYKDLSSNLYTAINQGMVILNRAKSNTEVKAFYTFLLSNKAQKIFKTYGYKTP